MPIYDCAAPDCLSCIGAFRRSTARRPETIVKVIGPGDSDATFAGKVVVTKDPLIHVGDVRRDWLRFAFKNVQ